MVDLDRAEANLQRAQDYADAHGVRLRPHIKTHKLPFFAKRQLELGAIGITCQKLGEAEVMADAGIEDIFLPYNIIASEKLYRLKELAKRVTLSVTADSAFVVDGYAETFADSAHAPLNVLVECDSGAGRCGVQTPDAAVALARLIAGKR
ncbi:MAG: alanine racemase, partial [Rhizobiales bacterium]|nr:alanine racemase [Hyphomicrobiales bacterium]